LGHEPFTLGSLKDQIQDAREAAAIADRTEPRIASARYDAAADRIIIDLRSGASFIFPPGIAQGLAGAAAGALSDITITPSGDGLRWDRLDADFGIAELLAGVFGTKAWLQEIGRTGGKVSSEAKAAAARANGKKGGRPKKRAV